jgi:hypothetical protein
MMIYVKHGKSKPKLKPKRERDEYEAWLSKHNTPVVKKVLASKAESWTYDLGTPVRGTQKIPSLNAGMMGNATMQPKKVYTGDKILGIGTLHKSNAVPVFSVEEAQDMAKMRR